MTDVHNASSLSDMVYQKLENDILSGTYKRGDSLHEAALAQKLGVSRTPLREALRRLDQDGLIKSVPNKGITVNGITMDDILDIYDIRISIEALALKKTASNITDEDISFLEETLELQEFYTQKGDNEKSMNMDSRFHATIYNLSGSYSLSSILCDMHKKIQRFRKLAFEDGGRAKSVAHEHYDILEALKSRDGEKAAALAVKHTINAKENLKKIYEEKKLWD